MLVSDRNIPLVYQGMQGSTFKSMLTVESYIKWYDIYIVSPMFRVSTLPRTFYQDFERDTGMTAWSDHALRPRFCVWLAEAASNLLEWDQPSLDMIRGRWIMRS